jgi:hypothetical protein
MTYTPIAASHFLGPSALPPLANTRPADEAGFAREEGISGFADAADTFRFRLDDWTRSSAPFHSGEKEAYRRLKFRLYSFRGRGHLG